MTSQRPRILIAVGSLEMGGTERQIVDVCRALREEFEFHVVTMQSGGALEPSLLAAGTVVYPLVPGGRAGSGRPVSLRRVRRAGAALLRFRRLIRTLRPAIIHAYLFEMSVLTAAARWPAKRPPLFVARRSLVQWIARGRGYLPLARWVNGQADLILANSEAVRRDVAAREGVDPAEICVIYNGVDCDALRPGPADEGLFRELAIVQGIPVVGMVANLHSYKGHEDMIHAAAHLVARGFEFTLLLVGRDEDAAAAIRELIRRKGLANVVLASPRGDVLRLFQVMDVVVSASHEEGFSNSILEAMATGRPVVATAVGGTTEQIVDGVDGLLVPPHEPLALAAAVGRLLESPVLRERLGAAARASVIERHSLHALMKNTRALYQRWSQAAEGH